MDIIKQEFEQIVKRVDAISDFEESEKLRQFWTNVLTKAGLKIKSIQIKRKDKSWDYSVQRQNPSENSLMM